jgi:hypothetical protein
MNRLLDPKSPEHSGVREACKPHCGFTSLSGECLWQFRTRFRQLGLVHGIAAVLLYFYHYE